MKSFLWEIVKIFLFLASTIGIPIWRITAKYDVYQSIEQNPIKNTLGAWWFVIVIIALPIVILLIKSAVDYMPMNFFKKVFKGLQWALPILALFSLSTWIANNIEFIKNLLLWWAGGIFISLHVAPNFVLKYVNGGK